MFQTGANLIKQYSVTTLQQPRVSSIFWEYCT